MSLLNIISIQPTLLNQSNLSFSISHYSWHCSLIVWRREARTVSIDSFGVFPEYIKQAAANVPARPSPPLQCTITRFPSFKYCSTTFFIRFLYYPSSKVMVRSGIGKCYTVIPCLFSSSISLAICRAYIYSFSSKQTTTSILKNALILWVSF